MAATTDESEDAQLHVSDDAQLHVSEDTQLHVSEDAQLHVSEDTQLHVSEDAQLHVSEDAQLHVCRPGGSHHLTMFESASNFVDNECLRVLTRAPRAWDHLLSVIIKWNNENM